MNIDNEISDIMFELFKHNEIHRIKVEVEFVNGLHISQETIKPNSQKETSGDISLKSHNQNIRDEKVSGLSDTKDYGHKDLIDKDYIIKQFQEDKKRMEDFEKNELPSRKPPKFYSKEKENGNGK